MPPRLRLPLPAPPLDPLVFLVALVVDFLRGVEGTEKWEAVPEALALARILKMRSEIARGVGRSRPVAGAVP